MSGEFLPAARVRAAHVHPLAMKVLLPGATRQVVRGHTVWVTDDGHHKLRVDWPDEDLAVIEARLLAELAFVRGERTVRAVGGTFLPAARAASSSKGVV